MKPRDFLNFFKTRSGKLVLFAVVFVLLNIMIDLIIAWLDPRIRYQ